jgi:hypothetical protein
MEAKMASKTIMTAAVGAVLLATTAVASAQHRAFPQDRYYGSYGYYGGYYDVPAYGPNYYLATPAPVAPGYYDYAPGPYYNEGPYYNGWNGWTYENGWNHWNDW